MGVSVDTAGITSRWADSDNPEWVWVAFRLDRLDDQASVAALREAVRLTNAAFEHVWLDEAGESTGAEGLAVQGDEVVMQIYSKHVDGPVHWLAEFALQAESREVHGRLTVHDEPAREIGVLASGLRAVTASVVLAVDGWDAEGRRAARAPWRADPSRIPEFVDFSCQFLDQVPGSILVHAGATSEVARGSVETALRSGLEADALDVPVSWALRFGATINRGVTFDRRGYVILTVEAPATDIALQVESAWRLGLTWVAGCSWIVMLEGGRTGSVFTDAYRIARQRRLPRYYDKHRDLDHERLPDAFARQVVTGAHLRAAANLSGWEVAQAAENRFEVSAPGWERWLVPPSGDASIASQGDTLGLARRDWGDVLMLT
jgi:hypothetical protein